MGGSGPWGLGGSKARSFTIQPGPGAAVRPRDVAAKTAAGGRKDLSPACSRRHVFRRLGSCSAVGVRALLLQMERPLYESRFVGVDHRLDAIAQVKLVQDALHM